MFWGAGGGSDGDGCIIFPAMRTPGEGGAVKSQKGMLCVMAVRFALLYSLMERVRSFFQIRWRVGRFGGLLIVAFVPAMPLLGGFRVVIKGRGVTVDELSPAISWIIRALSYSLLPDEIGGVLRRWFSVGYSCFVPHVRSRDHRRFCPWWKWVDAGESVVAVCFFVAVTFAFLALFFGCGGGGRVGCGYRSVVRGLVYAALEQLQRCSRCARSVAIKSVGFRVVLHQKV